MEKIGLELAVSRPSVRASVRPSVRPLHVLRFNGIVVSVSVFEQSRPTSSTPGAEIFFSFL